MFKIAVRYPHEDSFLGLYSTRQAQNIPLADGGHVTFVAGIPLRPFSRFMEEDRSGDTIVTGRIGPGGGRDCCHSFITMDVFGPNSDANYFSIVGLEDGGIRPIGLLPSRDGKAYLLPDDRKPYGKKLSVEFCHGYSPNSSWVGSTWYYLVVEHIAPGAWLVTYFKLVATSNALAVIGLFNASGEFYTDLYWTDWERSVTGEGYPATYVYTYGGGFSGRYYKSDWDSYPRMRNTIVSQIRDWASGQIREWKHMLGTRERAVDVFAGPITDRIFLQRPTDVALTRVTEVVRSLGMTYQATQREYFEDIVYSEYPDLVKEAVKDVQFVDINTAMYLRDLPSLFGELREAAKLIKILMQPSSLVRGKTAKRNVARAIKRSSKSGNFPGLSLLTGAMNPSRRRKAYRALASGSSLYLSYKYGTRLTFADSKELLKAFRRFVRVDGTLDLTSFTSIIQRIKEAYEKAFGSFSNVVRARSKTMSKKWDTSRFVGWPDSVEFKYQLNVSIRYHNRRQDALPVLNFLRQIDLYPTAVNIWDAVPYSFVVDWFVPVEELLEQVDVWEQLCWLDIISYTKTVKSICPVSIDMQDLGLSGLVLGDTLFADVGFYQRIVTDRLDAPVWDASLKLLDKSREHVPELTALMVQKWGRVLASRLR